jgi:hypothetical protein
MTAMALTTRSHLFWITDGAEIRACYGEFSAVIRQDPDWIWYIALETRQVTGGVTKSLARAKRSVERALINLERAARAHRRVLH